MKSNLYFTPRSVIQCLLLGSVIQCPLLGSVILYQLLENTHPPTRSYLLHRCRLAATPVALSPLSVRCERRGSAILQRRRGWSIPHLRLLGLDSALACRPRGSTSAPSSLASTVTHRSTSSTGLPHPSGSALVGRRPAIASGLLSSGCSSSLHPTGSVGLLPPLCSTWVLSCSGVYLQSSVSATRALGSTLAPRILSIPLARWLSVSGSSTTCSAAVVRPPGVGGHPSSLRRLHHGLAWLWPGSSCAPLAPGLSCLFPGSSLLRRLPGLCLPAPSPHLMFLRCEDAPSGRGRYVRIVDCFVCVLFPMCSLRPSFSLTLIVNLIPGVSHRLPQLSCV